MATPNNSVDSHGTEQVIKEIMAFRFPSAEDIMPKTATPSEASSTLQKAKAWNRPFKVFLRRLISFPIWAVGVSIIVAGVSMLIGAGDWIIRWAVQILMMVGAEDSIILMAEDNLRVVNAGSWMIHLVIILAGLLLGGWGGSLVDSKIKTDPFLQSYKNADKQVQQRLDALVGRNDLTNVLTKVVDASDKLAPAITAYKNHDRALNRSLKDLESGYEARRRKAFLDHYGIRHAEIPGINLGRRIALISFGIKTAADVDKSAILRVPGFDENLANKLLEWRRDHESGFDYDPTPNDQEIANEQELRDEFRAEKEQLESTIYNGWCTLHKVSELFRDIRERARSDNALNRALNDRAQAERDLELLGVSVPASTVTLTL